MQTSSNSDGDIESCFRLRPHLRKLYWSCITVLKNNQQETEYRSPIYIPTAGTHIRNPACATRPPAAAFKPDASLVE
ncbi:hypothetical protein DPEC_G00251010 [Dallia pectoralis]|uniref:Uncharacterized protein n=1 Tax=Dallia pectoralis TaxID=75939 RepID=A0ACC2FTA6_DALPE|nr:hypothetical protein DPEC_G00251010 [Dallia pectoralis]